MKFYLNHFTTKQSRVRRALDVGVLSHLTNGLLPETPFWDKLQQECRSVSEFYKKASNFLKLENLKEALHKLKKRPQTKRMIKERE